MSVVTVVTAHRVRRPEWRVTSVVPWPCPPARTALGAAFAGDPDLLIRHLTRLMAVADDDLWLPALPALYRRFVRWKPTSPEPPDAPTAGPNDLIEAVTRNHPTTQ